MVWQGILYTCAARKRAAVLCVLLAVAILAGCAPAGGSAAVAGGPAGGAQGPVPTRTAMLEVEPSATATEVPPTAVATPSPTPSPTATPGPIVVPTSSARENAFSIGGIDLASSTTQLTLRYPKALDSEEQVVVEGIDLLVSDSDGTNLAVFSNIGSWLGQHKIFVYPDTASGRPVLSVHDGTYAGVVLEAEPLRQLIEGSFRSPYAVDAIAENLKGLEGRRFVLEQDGAAAEFEVVEGVRMDADTTLAFRERPGELSTLLDPLPNPQDSFLILICSTRQPNEPDEIFPARFVLALQLAR